MSGSVSSPNIGTMSVASGAAAAFPVGFGYYPPEGSRVVSAQYNFSAQLAYAEDLSQLVARGVETSIQSVWIDNSQNSFVVTLVVTGSQQTIIVPPNTVGMYPVFFTGSPGFYIASAGANNNDVTGFVTPAVTRVLLLNVPASPEVYSTKVPVDGGIIAICGFVSSNRLKTGPGRLATVKVSVVTAVGTIALNDQAVGEGVTGQNTILTIPIGTAVNTIYSLNWPFLRGLTVNFNGGATGAVDIAWS